MSKPVVLINISNPEDMHIPPLGQLYIGNSLKHEGYDVEVHHISRDEVKKYAKKISDTNPLYVGTSCMTGNQTAHSATFSKEFKKLSDAPLVWGGIHPSLMPQQCINEKYIDVVAVGEGEDVSVDLAKVFEGKMRIEDVKGILWKKEGKIITNSPRPLTPQDKIDQYKLDYDLIDFEAHLDKQWGCNRILTTVTSRGCVYSCTFCYNIIFNERRWRAHSAEKVIMELKELKDRYGIDGVRFYDDFFFANPPRALKIVDAIRLPWFAEVRIDSMREKVVEKMIETECKEALFGLESGSERILKMMKKCFTKDLVKERVKVLSKAKDLKVVGSFILGVPTETRDEAFETIDFALELANIHENMRYSFGFYLPYPGSEMYDMAVKLGFKPPEKTEDWEILDRWSDKLPLTWLDWNQNPTYFMNVRRYMNLLPLRQTKLFYLNKLPEKRLRNKQFDYNFEADLLTSVQQKFATKKSIVRMVGTKILPYFMKSNGNTNGNITSQTNVDVIMQG